MSNLFSQLPIGTAVGFGVGHAVGPAISPLIRDLVNLANETHPSMPLDVAAAAQLVAENKQTRAWGAAEAAKNGVDGSRFDAVVQLIEAAPAVGELMVLAQRGAITPAQLEQGLRANRVADQWIAPVSTLTRRLIEPAALANMVVRGILTEANAAPLAAEHGVDAADFSMMVKLTGNPPAIGEMLTLWNRGAATEQDVERAMLQSDLKPEWFPVVKQMRFAFPTVSDQVRFAVREVYTPAIRQRFGLDQDFPPVFATETAKLGLSAEAASNYWAAHWDLPSPQQGFQMFHRGIISQADLELLLRSLDVMPFWRDRLIQLNHLVPGRIDLRRMFRANVITEQEVTDGYIRLGYTTADAQTLTDFAVAEKTKSSAERDLTKSEILSLYAGGITTEAETRSWLAQMRYDPAEIDALLNLTEARRMAQYARAAVGKVHTLFVAHRVDLTEATTALDTLGIAPTAVAQLIELWTIERDANMRDLTQAQVIAAIKKSVIGGAAGLSKLMQLGYSEQDGRILISSIGGDFGGAGQLPAALP